MENSKQKCPVCSKNLKGNYCMYCGYLPSGAFIGKNEPTSISDIEIYLGEKYDIINRNKNTGLIFILGPLYFIYSKCPIAGLIGILLDILIFPLTSLLGINALLTLLLIRIMHTAVDNMIYLWLCEKKIKIIKKKYNDNYKEILRANDHNTTSILSLIIALLIIVLFIIFIMTT